MITVDRAAAKAAGYTDSEIDSFINQNTAQSEPIRAPKIDVQAALKEGYTQEEINNFSNSLQSLPPITASSDIQPVEITQTYGQPSQYDVFSGGVNTGVDYAAQEGTPVQLPDGDWVIEDAYSGAQGGYIGDNENSGYGNSVVARNNLTGEKLRLSHLSQVHVQPGQSLKGGLIGTTGATGNVTGPHLDAEYYDNAGAMGDILQSPYGNIIPHK